MGCSETARAWMRILSAGGVGDAAWRRLARRMPPERIASMLESEQGRERLFRILGRRVGPFDNAAVAADERLLEGDRYQAIAIGEPGYPPLLAETVDPPPLLYMAGDPATAARPAVCIVGSRAASRRGRITARSLAADLAARGIAVVSGLARGIDTAAHLGAIDGAGGTVAVLGCGLDVPYPRENADLSVEIARRGCLVSEFPFGTPPLRHHFPRRNRILAGLSLGTVVVEAGAGSGAMTTALLAAEEGREVLAVPGPVDHPGSFGPHRLLRDGAALVETAADILAALPRLARMDANGSPETAADGIAAPHGLARGDASGPQAGPPAAALTGLSPDERRVVGALGLEPKHIDDIASICDIPTVTLLPVLLDLEMRGVVERCGAGSYAVAAGGHGRGGYG